MAGPEDNCKRYNGPTWPVAHTYTQVTHAHILNMCMCGENFHVLCCVVFKRKLKPGHFLQKMCCVLAKGIGYNQIVLHASQSHPKQTFLWILV